ncbi:expressed protein [Echinococcus multilocularis]|uniref:Expressed protein n=1 Tax=Echinococcus multilocularis TaxID=6211 RepID=A0A068Y5X6_ECHMU|nr:expressed protein [Echinococcus multilocularis]
MRHLNSLLAHDGLVAGGPITRRHSVGVAFPALLTQKCFSLKVAWKEKKQLECCEEKKARGKRLSVATNLGTDRSPSTTPLRRKRTPNTLNRDASVPGKAFISNSSVRPKGMKG